MPTTDLRARVARAGATIALLAVALAIGTYCGKGKAPAEAAPAEAPPPVAAPPVPAPPVPAPPVAPTPAPEDEPLEQPDVPAGTCRVSGYRVPDVAGAGDELRALVRDWLWPRPDEYSRRRPSIDRRRGILYVQSEEDRGDDPPYPRSADPEAFRACGSPADWLLSHLRERLSYAGELRCDGGVCCYDGMEYAPSGTLVFSRHETPDGPAWTLDVWAESYNAGIGPEVAEANDRFVTAALRRLGSTTCPGEKAGVD